jgi:hypothetical protein
MTLPSYGFWFPLGIRTSQSRQVECFNELGLVQQVDMIGDVLGE